MITGSIGLALVAGIFLVLGVLRGPELYYYASIGTSLVAAFVLIAGLRQHAAAQRAGLPGPGSLRAVTGDRSRSIGVPLPRSGRPARITSAARPGTIQEYASEEQHGPDLAGTGRAPADLGLPDEPPEQPLTAAVAAQLSRSGTEVVVVDGRPRFHREDCLHLLGRQTQRLPVREAMEGGFTPCAQCQPAGTSDVAERST